MGIVIAFIFGLILGSFLNVVILRFDDWLSIVRERSRCRDCQTSLGWLDLVPVLSFLFLRGRCRYCQKPISWQYPVVEIATAILAVLSYSLIFTNNYFDFWLSILIFALLILALASLVVIFFHDLYEMMIPDSVSYFLLLSASLFSLLFYQDWSSTVIGGLVGLAPIALLVYPSRGKWMGEGDVKLAAGIGLLVGWPHVLVFLASSFIIGGVVGALLIAVKQAKAKTAVPFAPFLILGGVIALFWGEALVSWYLGMIGYGYY